MEQRRKFFRWRINRQAKFKLEGAECFCDCQVKDINLKGAQVCLGLKLPKDTFLKFRIFLTKDCILDAEAWIVWHKTVSGTNEYGLYFTKLKDEHKEKIYQFVHKNHPDQIKCQYCQDINGYQKGGEPMQDTHFKDNRIFERFSMKSPLRFLDLKSNKEAEGETYDISAKGVGLVTAQNLQPRTPLELWIKFPDKGEPLYARGEVVWCSMVSPNEYRAGVNLEKANLMGVSRVLRTS